MEEKEVKISFWASHLTLIVSVTFVLLLIGVLSVVWTVVISETHRLQERISINVVMADSVSNSTAMIVANDIARKPYTHNVKLIGKAEAMRRWQEATGEDLMAMYGVNPLSPEIEFNLDGRYATSDQLDRIKTVLKRLPGVEAVDAPDSTLVSSMNNNLSNLTLILAIVAGIMLVVTFVLINNTVHLLIYSKRFTIHTMQLVGATKGFISKPIVAGNALCGLLAGLFASILTTVVAYAAYKYGLDIFSSSVTWQTLLVVSGSLTAAGIVLCGVASWIATMRYLRKDYDSLFR